MHRGISAVFKGADFPYVCRGSLRVSARGCATLISFSSNRCLSSSFHDQRSFSLAKDSKSRVIDTRNCLTCLATGLFTPKLSSDRRSFRFPRHGVADKPNGTSPPPPLQSANSKSKAYDIRSLNGYFDRIIIAWTDEIREIIPNDFPYSRIRGKSVSSMSPLDNRKTLRRFDVARIRGRTSIYSPSPRSSNFIGDIENPGLFDRSAI